MRRLKLSLTSQLAAFKPKQIAIAPVLLLLIVPCVPAPFVLGEEPADNVKIAGIELSFSGSGSIDSELTTVANWSHVTSVNVSRSALTDEHFSMIAAKACNLRRLDISHTDVSAKGLAEIRNFSRLQALRVAGTAIDDRTLQAVAGLDELEVLDLSETAVTNEGVAHLRGLSKLRHIDIRNTNLRPLKLLALPQFATLEIAYSPELPWEERDFYERTKEKAKTAAARLLEYADLLANGVEDDRVWAVEKLSSLGLFSQEPDRLLRKAALTDESEEVRTEAITHLGWDCDDPANVPIVIKALDDKSKKVRLSAVEGLGCGMRHHKEAAEALIRKGMFDKDAEVAEQAKHQIFVNEKGQPYLRRWVAEIANDAKAPKHTRELAKELMLLLDPPAKEPGDDHNPFE